MPHREPQSATISHRIRWAARGLGTLAGAVWLLAIIGSAVVEPPDARATEGVVLAILVVMAVGGVVLAWFRGRLGGLVLLGAGLALAVFACLTAGRNHVVAVAVSGLPFVLAGVMFLVSSSWRCS